MPTKLIVSLLAVAGLGSVLLGGASAATVPNPCMLVPSSAIATAFGGTAPAGVKSTRPDGKGTQTLCSFTKGVAKLQIIVAPHQASGGSGGVPGMVKTEPKGFGPGAEYVYDTNPHFTFASLDFTKAGLDVEVYGNGKLSNSAMIALGHKVYTAITSS
jgi:hypothetical protein